MASPQSALSSSSFFPMPDASYQWISASRIVPLGSLTLAYPLRFRHRPGPYIFRRRGSSRIEPPAANVSAPAISPQTSKNTPSAFYHLSGREHPGGNTRAGTLWMSLRQESRGAAAGFWKLGWDAGIRTPIRRSRVCSLTVRRRPNCKLILAPRASGIHPWLVVHWIFNVRNWLRAGLALVACAAGAQAVDWKALQPQGYVSDFAGVIPDSSRAPLEAYCAAVEQSTGAQMALVTIPSLEDEPIEDVANTIFRAWGVGLKGKNEGILMLLAVHDRRSRLEVGYGLEPILPDGLSGSILRQMRPALRQGDYGDAMLAAAETIGNAIAQAKHVTLTASLSRRHRPSASDSI